MGVAARTAGRSYLQQKAAMATAGRAIGITSRRSNCKGRRASHEATLPILACSDPDTLYCAGCCVWVQTMKDKKAKAEYDRKYRARNKKRIKANHAAYFQRTYDPKKAAVERKKNMPRHVEYCRQPKYRAWKKKYDRQRRMAKLGDFKDAWTILQKLKKEIHRQMPDRFERYAQSQRHQWNPINQQRRKRGNLNCNLNCNLDSF